MQKQWLKSVIALLLCTAILLSLAGCMKSAQAVDMVVSDAQDAITQLAELQTEFGYENALSELTEKSTTTIDGDSYYRLQQNYKGIPVYGRTVVCSTDEEGNVTSLTGNVEDVDVEISLTPSITSEQAQESIRAYVKEMMEQADADMSISDPITCVYNRNKLAYVFTITTNGSFFESHEVLVDAHDAGILKWNTYTASFDTNQYILEVADVNCEFDDSHNLKLIDTRRNHSVYYLDLETSQKYPTVEDVVGNHYFLATATPDQTVSGETHALAHLAQIFDFYAEVLDRQSYNNQGAPVYLFSCDANFYADQGLALAQPEYGVIMLGSPMNLFSEHLGKALDLIAHEYAHLVFQTEVGFSQGLDATSVNEGIADIFGNLIELYVEGKQDPSWPLAEDAGYSKYNMADPITMDSYGNAGHNNAQILSHSAYLMWNGIDNTASQKLTVQQLAKLWYRAVLMMPSNCNFNDCRQIVELAATSMKLTKKQLKCVSEAFDKVGITGTQKQLHQTEANYNIKPGCELWVYGGNDEAYDNYTLTIVTPNGPVIGPAENNHVFEETITSAEPYILDLPEGVYCCTVTDNANPNAQMVFDISVFSKNNGSKIDLYTNFGSTPVKGTVSTIKEENGVATNVPVHNAIISIYYKDQTTPKKVIHMSEQEHNFFNVDLPVGVYSFITEAEGYVTSTTTFELTAEKEVHLDIVLKENDTKRLTQVVRYYSSDNYTRDVLSYNEQGQLVSYATETHSGFDTTRFEHLYVYDEHGRLVQYLTEEASLTGGLAETSLNREYYYSADGKQSGWSVWGYDNRETKYKCEYDNLGRLIRESDSSEQNVTEYKYYDDSDLIASSISTVGFESEPYTTTNTYTYDSNGRLTEQISETTNSWGSSTIQLRYTYDYAPFAFVESYFEGAWHPYQLEIQKDIPSSLGTYWIDDNTQFEMRDGLLSKAISEHSTCEFFYD